MAVAKATDGGSTREQGEKTKSACAI